MKKIISGRRVAIAAVPYSDRNCVASDDDANGSKDQGSDRGGVLEIKLSSELLAFLQENPVAGRSDYSGKLSLYYYYHVNPLIVLQCNSRTLKLRHFYFADDPTANIPYKSLFNLPPPHMCLNTYIECSPQYNIDLSIYIYLILLQLQFTL